MSLYTAVTIGPIVDTMMLTSSPAGLWGASYLFSWIARNMIQYLVDQGVSQERFVSPYFTLSEGKVTLPCKGIDCEEMWQEGVGLFHDRIIFCSNGLDKPLSLVRDAREAVIKSLSHSLSSKNQLARNACEIKDWLKGYLRIFAVEGETVSPLLDLGKDLSALELEPRFSFQDEENLLLRLLEDGAREGEHNTKVKRFLQEGRNRDRWILNGDNRSVRDLKDIAANGKQLSGMKHERYYAVLNSDGDNMGDVLKSLDNDDEIRDYSSKCLLFCAKAARRMQEYGGVPLYAGGDDLLALLPVLGNDGCTIFGLVECLRKLFNCVFEDERLRLDGKPSISFGVSIQYYKSPLYEALERARNLLGEAKGGLKNACYLNLQKHSGQSARFCVERMDRSGQNLYDAIDDLLRKTSRAHKDDADSAKFLSGAGATIDLFESLFCQAIECPEHTSSALENLYKNLFDNTDQEQFEGYLKGLEGLTGLIVREAAANTSEWKAKDDRIRAKEVSEPSRAIHQLQSSIRLLHFMRERGDEEA